MVNWRDTLFFGFGPKLTKEQEYYLDSIFNNRLTIVNAKSGSGKTTLAVGAAKLLDKPLLYTFNPVEEGSLGFRPGNTREKEQDYLHPLKDALLEIGEQPVQALIDEDLIGTFQQKDAWVLAQSHTFARGTNKKGLTIIIDEAQNWTVSQLKKMLTRIHDNCRVIVIGHTGQIDLKNPAESGFETLIKHFENKVYCTVCNLTTNFRGELANDADEMEE